ncbi:MAG TPA: polyprenol monophosphomannose synthase [Anaerolineaceae bacterium]|nr:polyprenol monophosphomannose synthase [Anaerolineaceae bacterium]
MSICVIIPTFNEVENLPLIVERLRALPLNDLSILVIDDNSPDGTGAIADELSAKYNGQISVMHRSGKLGLGTAYISGFRQVLQQHVDLIAHMDADFSHEPEKLPDFVKAIESSDVVFGSRYTPGGSLDRDWPAWRKWLSNFGNTYARTILRMPIKDLTGGFRLWRRETLAAMPWDRVRSNGYVFMVETAYLAHKLGFRIKEVPIYFAERTRGKSKMNLSIQIEAALRVWSLIPRYRDLKTVSRRPSSS